ncbi:50S ribosomal protein L23 [Patescibacteria group bacterium]|nr:50S ribosomal protein L23 [Patescibacteria group bacterium]MBU1728218.1 50S ribosomal protein L23 [Patescibacteria group bacterium]
MKIIKKPRVTEKASFVAEQNVYTFDVPKSANKTEIKKAIFELYKVKPVKVNILTVPSKKIFVRGKVGTKSGGKKVLVYLKKEDKIEII